MAKNRVLFDKFTGSVVGYLDKPLFKLFEQQRDMECYHVVKMSEKEVNEAFEYLDMSIYSPMFMGEVVMFPHEEMTCLEIAYQNFDISYHIMGPIINNILDSFVFDKNEEAIVKTALGTVLIKYAQYSEGGDESDDVIDYEKAIIEVMKSFGLRKDI